MIPPLVRRCPECSHTGWSSRFAVVTTDSGRRLVECPACGHRFEPIDGPMLK
jgi:DNA-directed RNA polymerase subunit RPC12/RpoP